MLLPQYRKYREIIHSGWQNRGFYLSHARRALEQQHLTTVLQRGHQPPVRPPSMICFRINFVCDLRCKMCGQWGLTGTTKSFDNVRLRQRLSAGQIGNIIDEALPYRRPLIDMEGGEIFLHREIVGILEAIRSRGVEIKPVTNGTRLGRFAKDLVRVGVNALSVSIDGDEQTHDELRRVKGTFRKAVEGILAVEEAKQRYGSRRPFVQIATTVTRHTYESLEQMCETLSREQLPIGVVMLKQPVFIPGRAIEMYERLMEREFGVTATSARGFEEDYSRFDVGKLQRIIRRIQSRKYHFVVRVLPPLPVAELPRFYDYSQLVTPNRCTIPWDTPTIEPDGNVYPCNLFPDVSMGNIHKQSFLEIWYGPRYKKFRALLSRGLMPICRRCCQLTGA